MRNAHCPTANNAFSDAGFIRDMDPVTARRQFNMSLGLVVILGLATCASFLTLRVDAGATDRHVARATVQAPQLIHVRSAAQEMPVTRVGG